MRKLDLKMIMCSNSGGFKVPGDNYLVHFIKYKVNRVRPSTRLKSFSFPSGHSTAGRLPYSKAFHQDFV